MGHKKKKKKKNSIFERVSLKITWISFISIFAKIVHSTSVNSRNLFLEFFGVEVRISSTVKGNISMHTAKTCQNPKIVQKKIFKCEKNLPKW